MVAPKVISVAVLALLPGALAFKYAGRECHWYGTAPFCGSTDAAKGDVVQGEELIETTAEYTSSAACRKLDFHFDDNECLQDYGAGCITGYKRLWCKV